MKVITMTNEGGMEMAKNLLTSIKKVGIPLSQVRMYVINGEVKQQSVDYATPDFNRLMRAKVEVILDAMETNKEVLWVDTDIVFLKNCLEDIRVRKGTAEMCFQPNVENQYCAGFFYVRSSPRTKNFLKSIIEFMKQNPNVDDEQVFNHTLHMFGLLATTLPYWQYPVGRAFFSDDGGISSALEPSKINIVHNNWIVGNENKVARFKKNGLWNVDENILSKVEQKAWN